MTAGQSGLSDWALRGTTDKSWTNLGTSGEHGRRGNYLPTSPGCAPWVSIDIVEEAESRGMRRRAVPLPRIRGGLGAKSGKKRPRSLHFSWTGSVFDCLPVP